MSSASNSSTASKTSREWKLQVPLSAEDVRQLEVGDIVYLSGEVCAFGVRSHIRMVEGGVAAPIDLRPHNAQFHVALVVKEQDGKREVLAASPVASMRFSKWMKDVVDHCGLRAIIGKGGFPNKADVFREAGCVYLAASGSWCAAMYGQAIRSVKESLWEDLGMFDQMWVLDVADLGPTIVETDTRGNSLYELREQEQGANLIAAEKRLGVESFEFTSLL